MGPGMLVRLDTAEIAVVTAVHAPDPYRPRVRVVFDAGGTRLDAPFERNLWDSGDTVTAPLDPAAYHLDPLEFL